MLNHGSHLPPESPFGITAVNAKIEGVTTYAHNNKQRSEFRICSYPDMQKIGLRSIKWALEVIILIDLIFCFVTFSKTWPPKKDLATVSRP